MIYWYSPMYTPRLIVMTYIYQYFPTEGFGEWGWGEKKYDTKTSYMVEMQGSMAALPYFMW